MSDDALREAAAWVAESIGYPIQATMPDHPMPDRLWEALVDHVHADRSGEWHGNELSRDEVGAWLAEEANRADCIAVDAPEGGACCCEVSPPEFGGPIPDRECPIHGEPDGDELR